jgi:hypothetical protein
MATSKQRDAIYSQIEDPKFRGALIVVLSKIRYSNQQNINEYQQRVCKERVLGVSMVIYTQKNFYLLNELNLKISTFVSAGLYDHWMSRAYNDNLDNIEITESKILTVKKLDACFMTLFFGLTLSTVVFLLEIIINYLEMKKNSRVLKIPK